MEVENSMATKKQEDKFRQKVEADKKRAEKIKKDKIKKSRAELKKNKPKK